MKRLFSLFSMTAFLITLISPGVASAITFRRPVDFILSPMVSYYYDDNASTRAAQQYTCATSRVYNNHRGTDFRGALATLISAAATGELYYRVDGCPTYGYFGSSCGGGFGNHVRMDHEGAADGNGWVTIYAHMIAGSPAYYGTRLCSTAVGSLGSSGSSTAPHLHFEVRKYSYPNNDPFVGRCSGPVSFWTSVSGGIPSTMCGS